MLMVKDDFSDIKTECNSNLIVSGISLQCQNLQRRWRHEAIRQIGYQYQARLSRCCRRVCEQRFTGRRRRRRYPFQNQIDANFDRCEDKG